MGSGLKFRTSLRHLSSSQNCSRNSWSNCPFPIICFGHSPTVGRSAKLKVKSMAFPIHRPRRLRSSEAMRQLVREATLAPSQFILPLFVCEGEGVRKEIGSMPGNAQLSIDNLVREAEECQRLGLGGLILFGIPETKDEF